MRILGCFKFHFFSPSKYCLRNPWGRNQALNLVLKMLPLKCHQPALLHVSWTPVQAPNNWKLKWNLISQLLLLNSYLAPSALLYCPKYLWTWTCKTWKNFTTAIFKISSPTPVNPSSKHHCHACEATFPPGHLISLPIKNWRHQGSWFGKLNKAFNSKGFW